MLSPMASFNPEKAYVIEIAGPNRPRIWKIVSLILCIDLSPFMPEASGISPSGES